MNKIERAAADCRKAFEGIEVGALALHCHHQTPCEVLTEPPENRIAYNLADKPKGEQVTRLRAVRPASPRRAEPNRVRAAAMADANRVRAAAMAEPNRVWAAAMADANRVFQAVHAAECPGCLWTPAHQSILP